MAAMKVTAAMIADAARVENGRLYVLGGAFSAIRVRKLPAVVPSVSVVLVMDVPPEDRHRDLDITVSLIDEDGHDAGRTATTRLRVGTPANARPGDVTNVPLVIPFFNLTFPEAKGYAFSVRFEDDELARIRLRVDHTVPAGTS